MLKRRSYQAVKAHFTRRTKITFSNYNTYRTNHTYFQQVVHRCGNTPSLKHSAASRAISGANMSELDFNTDVGMQSIGDDFAGIEQSSFFTSSTVGVVSASRSGP